MVTHWTSKCCEGLVLVAALAIALALPPAGRAQSPNPAAAATTVYEPGDVFLPGSRVYVFVGKTGFGHEHAVVGQLKPSRLRLDAAQDAGQLVFDMASFSADTDSARQYLHLEGTTPASTQQQVNANMLGSAVLDAAHFPTASFVVRSATRLPQPSARNLAQYQLTGDLTLHGVTQPIQIVAEAEVVQGWTHLRGGFAMRQTQFGITPFAKAFGAVGVTDELRVYGDLWVANQRQVAAATAQGP